MIQSSLILDVGSHSLKVYLRDNNKIELKETITLQLLEKYINEKYLKTLLENILIKFEYVDNKYAIGTEALRKYKTIKNIFENVLNKLNINFKIISQIEEAELIKNAVQKSLNVSGYDIVNVGGGSIQIVTNNSQIKLFNFGISFLNKEFNLNSVNLKNRDIQGCISFLKDKFNLKIKKFIYTGGEKTYLKNFDFVNLQKNGFCTKKQFEKLAFYISNKSDEELKKMSPYDPNWMLGAIASNCIVLSLLDKSSSDYFFASDINISHGLILESSTL